MQVVYSPVPPRPRHHPRDVHGRRSCRPTRSPSGPRSSGPRSRPTAGSRAASRPSTAIDPIIAVHDHGLVRFLEVAWSEVRAQDIPRPFLSADTVPEPLDVRGHERRGDRRAGPRAGVTPAGGPGSGAWTRPRRWSPARTCAARGAVDVALTTVDLVLAAARRPPTGCAGRPATTPRARCTAATASSTTRRSRPRRSRARTGERVAILDVDYHHGNGTQQIFWRRGDVRYVSHPRRPRSAVPVLPRPRRRDRRGRGGRREPEHPAAGRRDQRRLPRGHGPRLRGDRRRRRARGRRVARLRHVRARPDRRLRPDDRRLPRGRPAGRRARSAAGHPPGGRLPPAVARRERPGLAARRRGPTVRAAAGGRLRAGGSVVG